MVLGKILGTVCTAWLSTMVTAQTYSVDSAMIAKYHFVHWDTNHIEFYGESPAFKGFFRKMDSAYEGTLNGNVNIFHIGGSHIQAGTYAHRIRRYLKHMRPHMKGERGVVFPYTLAGTNNPWNYKIWYTGHWVGKRNSVLKDEAIWGMEGITALTNDTVSTIKIGNRKTNRYRYNYSKVKVLHNAWDSLYHLEPMDSSLVDTFYVDDSLNFTMFELNQRVEEFEFRVIRVGTDTSHHFMIFGIDLKNDDPGVIYHTIGVNGASFRSYRRCELFEEQLSQYPPDLFVISVGTNDTYVKEFDSLKYENYYEDFMKMILRTNPKAAILLTVPNDSYFKRRYANPHTKTAARAIVRLAKKYDMAVWNLYEIMGGYGSSQHWYLNKLMPKDRIHFTGKGYDLKADMFMQAFYEAWDSAMGRPTDYLFRAHLDTSGVPDYVAIRKAVAEAKGITGDSNTISHTVRRGQSLGLIGQKYGVSAAQIREWNSMSSNTIHPGDVLTIYVAAGAYIKPDPPPPSPREPEGEYVPKGNYYYYTIRKGDTLWDIAIAKGVTVDNIKRLNPGLNETNLKIGSKIRIKPRK